MAENQTSQTDEIRIMKGKGYTSSIELIMIGCIIYYLLYGHYPLLEPGKEYTNIQQFIQYKSNKSISFDDLTENDKENAEYKPIMELCENLINIEEDYKRKKDAIYFWKEFKNNKFVKDSITEVEELFKKYNLN